MTTTDESVLDLEDGIDRAGAVYQALGAASACWEHLDRAGVFESNRARAIGQDLMAWLDAHDLEDVTTGELLAELERRFGDNLVAGTELLNAIRFLLTPAELEDTTPLGDPT
jgi:hypothetical protein